MVGLLDDSGITIVTGVARWYGRPVRTDAAPSTAPRRRRPSARPRRGRPEDTRQRLIATAAEEFNRVGYRGTDSNRLARAAGYAPGTFYRHFPDKRAAFLAVYEAWVTAEWKALAAIVREAREPRARAARIVDFALGLHRRWRGLRASLRALVAEDAVARAFYRAQRRRQLELVAGLRSATQRPARRRERDAVLLYAMERVCDAVADGELRDLGLAVEPTVDALVTLVADHLAG
jgi:AcrR family transcriptional regulator